MSKTQAVFYINSSKLINFLLGVSLAALGSACYGLRFASVLRCATHC
ncbi:MAG: hypothetical protein NZ455_12320 [Bacteroidia bacterium]|nr:hypothetical protein [Bacteroidia bacterium]MDW8348271.1 hypothetical protein [Bacteroidia bacterium]